MNIHTKIEYGVDNVVKGKIGFNSAKADRIFYNARWHREALIQLSLRSDVLRILPHVGSRNHPKDVHLRLVSRSGHSVLALVEQTVRFDEEIYPAQHWTQAALPGIQVLDALTQLGDDWAWTAIRHMKMEPPPTSKRDCAVRCSLFVLTRSMSQ